MSMPRRISAARPVSALGDVRRKRRRLLGQVRRRRERDRAAELQIARVARRHRRRPQRGLPALRVAGDHKPLADAVVELARGARHVEHRRALRAPDQVRVLARRPEALVVGADDRVARVEPAPEQRRPRAAAARRRARVGDTGRPVRPRDQRPAALRRVSLRDRQRPGHRRALAIHALRAVEQQAVAGAALECRLARQLARPDQRAVRAADQRLRWRVEGRARRALADLGVGGRGQSGEEEQAEDEREARHDRRP